MLNGLGYNTNNNNKRSKFQYVLKLGPGLLHLAMTTQLDHKYKKLMLPFQLEDGTNVVKIHSRLSRCSTARGSDSGLCLGGPTRVKAGKSFLFTEGSLKVEKKNFCDFFLH